MLPDAETLFAIIDILIVPAVDLVGAAIGALFLILFVIYLFMELLQNVRAQYYRR